MKYQGIEALRLKGYTREIVVGLEVFFLEVYDVTTQSYTELHRVYTEIYGGCTEMHREK